MGGSLVLVGLVILVIGIRISMKRFEARRRQEGAWNENGPIDPIPARPLAADAYAVFDGGLRRAFERRHGAEGRLAHEPIGPPPIIEEIKTTPEPPPSETPERT